MSLILDALRKSDGQRQRKASERLREGPGPARRARLAGLSAVLALLLVMAVLLLALANFPPAGEGAQADGAPDEIMENKPPVRPVVRALNAELAARPAPRNPDPVTNRGPSAVPVEAPAMEAVTVDDQLDAPRLESLPPERRARIPALHVDVHAWARNPDERFVLINLRRYHEGDRLEEGPLLRQIQPDGVVLEYQGERFSLPRR